LSTPHLAGARSWRRNTCALALAAAIPALGAAAPAAAAPPHLVLSAPHGISMQVPKGSGSTVAASVTGLQLTNTGGDLTLRATRRGSHVRIVQQVRGAHEVASITATRRHPYLLSDGLPGVLSLELSNDRGVAVRMRASWCPKSGTRLMTPASCGDALSKDVTWVLAHGQTVGVFVTGAAGQSRALSRLHGSYRVVVRVDEDGKLVRARAPVELHARLKRIDRFVVRQGGVGDPPEEHGTPPSFNDQPAALAILAGSKLPDLLPLPAEDLQITHDANHGDTLRFAADIANIGADLTVDGRVSPGDPAGSMSAAQIFAGPNGQLSHPAGHLVFDNDDGHNHWHFFDLAHYRLTRADGATVQLSTKVGFCFGDSAPYDLSVPGAPITPIRPPLHDASCEHKHPGATSVHETLDSGWLDRYDQYIAGQAFDITKLPNGHYAIAIDVDPRGMLAEVTRKNNRAVRTFALGGKPGHRTATVPPVDGVDTERVNSYT
jgi:hypothetical protein